MQYNVRKYYQQKRNTKSFSPLKIKSYFPEVGFKKLSLKFEKKYVFEKCTHAWGICEFQPICTDYPYVFTSTYWRNSKELWLR